MTTYVCFLGSRIKKGVFNKSYLTSNPLVKYAAERSMRLTPVQKRQNEVSKYIEGVGI